MKKWIIALISLTVLMGCTKKTPLENIGNDYSMEMAIEDDCVVVHATRFRNGQDDWIKFTKNQISEVRVARYSYNTLEEILDGAVYDIKYKNGKYILTYYHEGEIFTEQYNYLLSDEYDGMTYYYLDNDQESYEDTFQKALSSSIGPFSFRLLFKIRK